MNTSSDDDDRISTYPVKGDLAHRIDQRAEAASLLKTAIVKAACAGILSYEAAGLLIEVFGLGDA